MAHQPKPYPRSRSGRSPTSASVSVIVVVVAQSVIDGQFVSCQISLPHGLPARCQALPFRPVPWRSPIVEESCCTHGSDRGPPVLSLLGVGGLRSRSSQRP